jgi:hypothetical protein
MTLASATADTCSNPSADELFDLADQYRAAAHDLLAGDRARWAPARLCAIHAIELYLNAFLLRAGEPAKLIRSYQHDLGPRAESARAKGLLLRRKTMDHLVSMSRTREYLNVRYAPGTEVSQQNRLIATLEEVVGKVRRTCIAKAA